MKKTDFFSGTIIAFRMNIILAVVALLQIFSTAVAQEYAIGADLSFLKNAEDRGFIFKENDIPKPGLQIFKDHGYNWIRLRLFHTPTALPNTGMSLPQWEVVQPAIFSMKKAMYFP